MNTTRNQGLFQEKFWDGGGQGRISNIGVTGLSGKRGPPSDMTKQNISEFSLSVTRNIIKRKLYFYNVV